MDSSNDGKEVMTGRRPLRIGLFTHSTNPRGGVVHVLELAAALGELGHDVVVHAPDSTGRGFFRPPPAEVRHVLIPARPVSGPLAELVWQRIVEYFEFLRGYNEKFDIYHAHDGISGGALALAARAGTIPGFVRTIHHLDEFADPYLRDTQDDSITRADAHFCVSRLWQSTLRDRYGIEAAVVNNGVDVARYTPEPLPGDEAICRSFFDDSTRPMFLAVGGIERRKNTLRILQAFLHVRRAMPNAGLLIVGGASLLDHSDYRAEFDRLLVDAGEEDRRSVQLTGPLPERAMAPIYRACDALVFPSITEGFGLAVIEAMACGTPVITSRIAPFTEYLSENDALLVAPENVKEIAVAMMRSLDPTVRASLRAGGFNVAARFRWSSVADSTVNRYREQVMRQEGEPSARNAFSSSMAR